MADKRYRPYNQEYVVRWRWIHDNPDEFPPGARYDTVEATTAPRAIAKVKRLLANEYAFDAGEFIVIAAIPRHMS